MYVEESGGYVVERVEVSGEEAVDGDGDVSGPCSHVIYLLPILSTPQLHPRHFQRCARMVVLMPQIACELVLCVVAVTVARRRH